MIPQHLLTPGYIHMVVGTMDSFKSLELILIARHIEHAVGMQVIGLKPLVDTYSVNIQTDFGGADGKPIEFTPTIQYDEQNPFGVLDELVRYDPANTLIIHDEDHMVPQIANLMREIRMMGFPQVGAALQMLFNGDSFMNIAEALTLANSMEVKHAWCKLPGIRCRAPAYFTQRLHNGNPDSYDSPVIIPKGTPGYSYHPACYKHHSIPGRPRYKPSHIPDR